MARIRTIKPEFWTDGAVVSLSPLARLFFIGTWNFALCDQGHLPDDPVRLKLQILPMDDVDPLALIGELIQSGRIVRLRSEEGRSYLHIRRFTDHQKVEKRWAPRCPACNSTPLDVAPETSPNLAEPPSNSPTLPETPTTSAQEGKGREGIKPLATALRIAESDEGFSAFWSAYPRRVGKDAARKAWVKAVKTTQAEDIIAGAKRYAEQRQGQDAQYTAHPSSWLNAGRWQDEPARPVDDWRRYSEQ